MGRLLAEAIGTFWLVLGGCGSAVLAAAFPDLGIGFLGVSLAFGLTVLSMATAIGHISGCHLNPAVTAGLAASGLPGFDAAGGGFASNGYGEHSPGGYPWQSCFIIETVLTAVFLFVIHGATDKKAGSAIAPIAIGLCLTLIHLISIPVTNTSVNPARSTATAIFAGGWALQQLWLFWVAPIVGGILGGVIYKAVADCHD
jgi:aquaporin Z